MVPRAKLPWKVKGVRDFSGTPEKRFLLGFEGERWDETLEALLIPYEHEWVGAAHVIVTPNEKTFSTDGRDWYSVITRHGWEKFDNLLMLAAYIRNYFDGLQENAQMGRTELGDTEGS